MTAPSPPSAARPGGYAAATETLRATVRWLVTAAAAVGGALVAGLQLTGIGSLGRGDLPRLCVAVTGLAAALLAVGYMVLRASQILTDEWVTLAELDIEKFQGRARGNPKSRRDRQRRQILDGLYSQLEFVQDELFASLAPDVSALYAKLMRANEEARRDPGSVSAAAVGPLQQAASAVVEFANFYITRERLKQLRAQLGWAAAVTAVGVLVFAYAVSPPKPQVASSGSTVDRSPAAPASCPTPVPGAPVQPRRT